MSRRVACSDGTTAKRSVVAVPTRNVNAMTRPSTRAPESRGRSVAAPRSRGRPQLVSSRPPSEPSSASSEPSRSSWPATAARLAPRRDRTDSSCSRRVASARRRQATLGTGRYQDQAATAPRSSHRAWRIAPTSLLLQRQISAAPSPCQSPGTVRRAASARRSGPLAACSSVDASFSAATIVCKPCGRTCGEKRRRRSRGQPDVGGRGRVSERRRHHTDDRPRLFHRAPSGRPTAEGLPARRRCQKPWLTTAAGGPPNRSSSGVGQRPSIGAHAEDAEEPGRCAHGLDPLRQRRRDVRHVLEDTARRGRRTCCCCAFHSSSRPGATSCVAWRSDAFRS